jgi:hypothetical protein
VSAGQNVQSTNLNQLKRQQQKELRIERRRATGPLFASANSTVSVERKLPAAMETASTLETFEDKSIRINYNKKIEKRRQGEYTENTMQLPSPFRPFPCHTLIVVTNTLQAKTFLANGRDINESGVIDVTTGLEQENGERRAIKFGGPGQPVLCSNDEYGTKKDHLTKDHFYSALNKELMRRLQNDEFDVLVFTVPEDLENELKESLHGQLLRKTKIFVPRNLMNDDLVDIVATIQETGE